MCSALQLFYCCVCTAMEKLRCEKQFWTVTYFIYLKSLFRASGVLLSALVMLTLVRIKVQISVRIQISLGDSQYHSKATYCQKIKKKKSKNSSYSGLISVAASLYKLCNSAPTACSFSSSSFCTSQLFQQTGLQEYIYSSYEVYMIGALCNFQCYSY